MVRVASVVVVRGAARRGVGRAGRVLPDLGEVDTGLLERGESLVPQNEGVWNAAGTGGEGELRAEVAEEIAPGASVRIVEARSDVDVLAVPEELVCAPVDLARLGRYPLPRKIG